MNKFVNGDCIKDIITNKTGVISDPFFYERADDGTHNRPGEDMYPVQWDDGTQGYRHSIQLEYA